MGLFGRMPGGPSGGLLGGYYDPSKEGTFAPSMPMGGFGDRPEGIDQAAAYTGPAKRGGLFGSGINLRQIAGALGDALLAANGNASLPYASLQAQQRQQQNALARMQAQRQQELQDQMALKEWERNNPAPTEAQRNFDFYQRADPATRALYDRMRAGDPYVTTTLPNKQIYSGPASGLPSALGGNPANLDMQPGEEDGYVYTPGPGGRGNEANWKPKGGPAMTSGGGFR